MLPCALRSFFHHPRAIRNFKPQNKGSQIAQRGTKVAARAMQRALPNIHDGRAQNNKGACTMKRFLVMTMAVALTVVALAVPSVWAGDVEGKIKSVDQTGRMLTLEDGTKLMIPASVRVNRKDLMPGTDVKDSFEDKGTQEAVTQIEVRPAK